MCETTNQSRFDNEGSLTGRVMDRVMEDKRRAYDALQKSNGPGNSDVVRMGGHSFEAPVPINRIADNLDSSIVGLRELNTRLGVLANRLGGPVPESAKNQVSPKADNVRALTIDLKEIVINLHATLTRIENAL